MDTYDYKKYLVDKNFIIQENTYSSGSATLFAFAQMYSCGALNIKSIGNSDVGRRIRDLIGGDESNLLFRTLKNNGYSTVLITTNSGYYYLHNKGKYLDEVDFDIEITSEELIRPIISVSYFCEGIHKGIKLNNQKIYKKSYNGYKGGLVERVKHAMRRYNEFGNPYIIAFKGGAEHTPSNGSYIWNRDRDKWISSKFYQDLVKKSDEESKELLNYILENDPDSIIILLGDHGAWSYRAQDGRALFDYSKYNLNVSDLFDDYYRVLFAYRLPQGAQDDISHGMYMNNINVFMHIFAYLAGDPSILQYREQSVSKLGNAKMVEGKLVLSEKID